MKINIDNDTKSILDLIQRTTKFDRKKSMIFLTEIGLISIISYPTGIPRIDNVLEKYPDMVSAIKRVWK